MLVMCVDKDKDAVERVVVGKCKGAAVCMDRA